MTEEGYAGFLRSMVREKNGGRAEPESPAGQRRMERRSRLAWHLWFESPNRGSALDSRIPIRTPESSLQTLGLSDGLARPG